MSNLNEQKRNFWNDRAKLGEVAGSDDFMLKKVETDFILRHIPHGGYVLDIGCGNGTVLITAHEKFSVSGVGLDFSREMTALAQKNAKQYHQT